MKASDTLKKKYGACYNKNLLFIALLRHHGIACSLAAHPMSRTFTRPATGSAHRFFSHPYYHCFTRVRLDESWITIDPTLDTLAWETFFKPCGLGWGIGWNDKGMPPLYEESIMGQCRIYNDIDTVLKGNLDSWFLFKHAPALLIRLWLWAGNTKMWMQVEKNRVTQPVV